MPRPSLKYNRDECETLLIACLQEANRRSGYSIDKVIGTYEKLKVADNKKGIAEVRQAFHFLLAVIYFIKQLSDHGDFNSDAIQVKLYAAYNYKTDSGQEGHLKDDYEKAQAMLSQLLELSEPHQQAIANFPNYEPGFFNKPVKEGYLAANQANLATHSRAIYDHRVTLQPAAAVSQPTRPAPPSGSPPSTNHRSRPVPPAGSPPRPAAVVDWRITAFQMLVATVQTEITRLRTASQDCTSIGMTEKVQAIEAALGALLIQDNKITGAAVGSITHTVTKETRRAQNKAAWLEKPANREHREPAPAAFSNRAELYNHCLDLKVGDNNQSLRDTLKIRRHGIFHRGIFGGLFCGSRDTTSTVNVTQALRDDVRDNSTP